MDRTPAPTSSGTNSEESYLKYLVPLNRSGWAIAAGYLGLFALLLLPAPAALVVGLVALRDLKKRPGKLGKGRAWFAVIFGGIMTLLLALLLATAIF